ncbi:hypothetical protein [Parasulfitobacter algicola]|uniref:Lipoprotein n=1 Tax=Parasulfitobacter algicola TaxID=2614809 RepID=A0ABX2IKZ1_9RHOB|nr:hypothetical protein [Sulfitobacter algicola]NSX53235.1 hypothetical protein [Sulfitobacter algicola]
MRIFSAFVVFLLSCSISFSEIILHETPGDLSPTRDLECIALSDITSDLTPPDLGLGVQDCMKQGRFDDAVELYIVMQLFARYDTQRVADISARQASHVLSIETSASQGEVAQKELGRAFTRFGKTGSPRHSAVCNHVGSLAPPSYHPSYMIKHGLAFIQGKPRKDFVPGFNASATWSDVLESYLKCS